jgi:hypothetical protein
MLARVYFLAPDDLADVEPIVEDVGEGVTAGQADGCSYEPNNESLEYEDGHYPLVCCTHCLEDRDFPLLNATSQSCSMSTFPWSR